MPARCPIPLPPRWAPRHTEPLQHLHVQLVLLDYSLGMTGQSKVIGRPKVLSGHAGCATDPPSPLASWKRPLAPLPARHGFDTAPKQRSHPARLTADSPPAPPPSALPALMRAAATTAWRRGRGSPVGRSSGGRGRGAEGVLGAPQGLGGQSGRCVRRGLPRPGLSRMAPGGRADPGQLLTTINPLAHQHDVRSARVSPHAVQCRSRHRPAPHGS